MTFKKFMTPIRFKIEQSLPNLVRKYCPKEANILDHGCGDGKYSQLFKEMRNFKYIGIDVKKNKMWDFYSNENISYQEQDGTHLSFQNEKFNFLLSITSLEHIKDDQKAIVEMYRVLEKERYIIIIVPTKPYWLFQLGRHCYHHNSKKELFKLIKTQPFKIIEYEKIGGLLSFLFTWVDIWVSQIIILPFWIFQKMKGKKLNSTDINKILEKTVHWYIKFKWSHKIYFSILKFINRFDNLFKILPNHHLMVLKK